MSVGSPEAKGIWSVIDGVIGACELPDMGIRNCTWAHSKSSVHS